MQLARWIDIEGRLPLLITAGALVLTFGVLGILAMNHGAKDRDTARGGAGEPELVSLAPEDAPVIQEAVLPVDPVAEPGEDPSSRERLVAEGIAGSSARRLLTTHEVQAGDTLYGISRKHYGKGTYWQVIADANQLGSGPIHLRIGDKLSVPDLGAGQAPRPRPHTVVVGDDPEPGVSGHNYQVQVGDTLWKIAERELGAGARWTRITDANPGIESSTPLRVGQDLIIPEPD